MDKNVKHYPLAQTVEMPQHCAYVVRDLPQATVEQRERALNATHWNEFAFPSGMLTVDAVRLRHHRYDQPAVGYHDAG